MDYLIVDVARARGQLDARAEALRGAERLIEQGLKVKFVKRLSLRNENVSKPCGSTS